MDSLTVLGPRVFNLALADSGSLGELWGAALSASRSFWGEGLRAFLGCGRTPPMAASLSSLWCQSSFCLFLRTLVMAFGAQPDNPG